MTRLSEIFLRSSFRAGADRSLELSPSAQSGGGAEVFEVADLLIPAGTDWVGGHVVHTFDVAAGAGGIFLALDLEVDEAPESDVIQIYLRDAGNTNLFQPATGTDDVGHVADSTTWAVAGICSRAVVGNPNATEVEMVIEATDSTYGAATTADITVVYARAAFLTI